jgi:hypothetical protein
MKSPFDRMTAAQRRAMVWLAGGHKPVNTRGDVVEVNGERLCPVSTMRSLMRSGYVTSEDNGRGVTRYEITTAGRAMWRNAR